MVDTRGPAASGADRFGERRLGLRFIAGRPNVGRRGRWTARTGNVLAGHGPASTEAQTPMPAANINYQRTREMTIDELLLENRIVFLIGEINHASAARVMMQLLYLDNQKKGQDISLYINSPGGAVDDTLALYDTMRFLGSPVATYCIGRAYSGGSILLASGTKGKRFILPHAKVMIHQPYGGITGQAEDIRLQAEQIIKAKRTLNEILSRHTGQDVERIQADGERDKYFTAQEAVEYGLVDEVLDNPPETA
ncbi:MAG: ATP-dependent Clp protease proteolytic subunit [Planctomycetota bacterium]